MGRPLRDLASSEHFHISNRGIDGQDIFGVEGDRTMLDSEFARANEKHGLEVLVYAWMTNHIHALVYCPGSALPTAIGEIQSRYTKRYNSRTARTGPLFERRYWSKPVTDDAQLVASARYIHLNPVDICGPRALPAYAWSSLPVYLGRRTALPWMSTDLLGERIDRPRYLAELLAIDPSDILPMGDLPPLRQVNADQIEAAIERASGACWNASPDGRALADLLGEELRVADIVERARRRGISPRSLRNSIRAASARAAGEPQFARFRARVLADITRHR
jgi:REP element-mobilizing transposase RayT